ncbi:MAG: hypothetical protein GX804_07635 [Lentisphaerae bacterium]|nr:hypothetical protein [Lentisphaerota bacterium]
MRDFLMRKTICFVLVAVLSAGVLSVSSTAQEVGRVRIPPEAQIELEYIGLLQSNMFPDYAELVIKDFEVRFPSLKPLVEVEKLKQILQQGRFDDARAIIAAKPDQESADVWAMTLTLADFYYAGGKYSEAMGIYSKFFDKYKGEPPADIKEFYLSSLYKYAQMLLFLEMNEQALKAYDDLLSIKDLDEATKRQSTFESAELAVRLAQEMKPGKERDALFAKAKTRIESLLWEQDLWFARSLVLMAHVEVIKGDVDRATKLINDYMPQLRSIEAQLVELGRETGEDLSRLSPIAEVRYLMGVMMYDEVQEKLKDANITPEELKSTGAMLVKALQEFANVYAQYSNTSWAPDAMVFSEEIQELLKTTFGAKDIKIDVSAEQRRDIAMKQFANARMLYNQVQYERAIESYLIVLNQFPELVPDSIMAMSELARSYIEFADSQKEAEAKQYCDLTAEMIIGHLAERFSKSGSEGMPVAGDELRRIAEIYSERNNIPMREFTYSLFFNLYPEHPLAAPLLMSFSENKFKDDDFEGAIQGYTTLKDRYQKSQLLFPAMRRLADSYSKIGNVEKEIEVRMEYVESLSKREEPGQEYVTASYVLTRMNRNIALNELRAANALVNEIRRSGAPIEKEENDLEDASDSEKETDEEEEGEKDSGVITLDEAMKRVADANQKLIRSVNEFGKIINMLSSEQTRKKYEKNAREKEINSNVLQGCMFDRSYTLSALTQPADKLASFKQQSIKSYEQFLNLFPDATGVPTVLMQLGTLYSTTKTDDPDEQEPNIKKVDSMFSRLSEEYPESDEARKAYFTRGRTLIELGFRQEGVEVLKRMFTDSGQYSASQMFLAAEELMKSKEYDLARQGFDLAMKMSNNEPSIVIPSRIGLAKIMIQKKEYNNALTAIETFIEENPRSYAVIEANDLLSEAAKMVAFEEPDRNERIKLFNRALKSLQTIEQHMTGAQDRAEITIKKGKILETKIDVEKKFDNPDIVDQYIGEAALFYQRFTISADKRDAGVLPSLEYAFYKMVRLLLEMKEYSDGTPVYEDVKEDCQKYLQLFPTGRYINEMRSALTEAEIGSTISAK